MTGDAFVLLRQIFNVETFDKSITDSDFILKLFSAIEILNQEAYSDAVCEILIESGVDEQTTALLNLIGTHDKARLFIETAIHVLNRSIRTDCAGLECFIAIVKRDDKFAKIFDHDLDLLIEFLS